MCQIILAATQIQVKWVKEDLVRVSRCPRNRTKEKGFNAKK